MILWLLSLAAGVSLAALAYRVRPTGPVVPVFGLRVLAGTIAAGLLLNAALGPSRPVAPWIGLDVSGSWRASGDSAAWRSALAVVDSLQDEGADSLLFFGDSVRGGSIGGPIPLLPSDAASRVGALVEAALAVGRPLAIVTDGALDDPERVARLPRGSLVRVVAPATTADAAIALLDVPGGALGGDTLQARVVVKAGAGGAAATTLTVSLDGRMIAETPLPALDAFEEREVRTPVPIPSMDATRRIAASLAAGGAVAENDTASAEVVVSGAAAATFISTSPDQDARFALAVLRGTRRGPVQGFWRVAPGQWRVDGSLREVTERAVRDAARGTPMLVIHGDTAIFGAPRSLATGALVLISPPAPAEDYYPSGTGDSPVSAALAGVPWDSLAPLDVAPMRTSGRGMHSAVLTRRGRRFEERTAILLEDLSAARRVAVVPAAGFWRWRLRGGRSADAFNAMWGSVFDWVGADPRSGAGAPLARRGVNPEWVPRRASVSDGAVGDGVALDRAPRSLGANAWWLALIAITALCAEWLLRRKIGLR
jgi:hypothetical protein